MSSDTSRLAAAAARSMSASASSAASAMCSTYSAVSSATAAAAYGAASVVSSVRGGDTAVNALASIGHMNAATATQNARKAEEASAEAITQNIGAQKIFPMQPVESKHGAAFLARMFPGGNSFVNVLSAVGSTRASEEVHQEIINMQETTPENGTSSGM